MNHPTSMNPTLNSDNRVDPIVPVVESQGNTSVIPVIEEQLLVEKQSVETGRLLIRKAVLEEEQTVDIPLMSEAFSVERVAVNQYVDTPPVVRYDGDTTIFPVLKEVLVTEKRLMLVEEVRVTRQQLTTSDTQRVTLRREEVTVQRVDSETGRSV